MMHLGGPETLQKVGRKRTDIPQSQDMAISEGAQSDKDAAAAPSASLSLASSKRTGATCTESTSPCHDVAVSRGEAKASLASTSSGKSGKTNALGPNCSIDNDHKMSTSEEKQLGQLNDSDGKLSVVAAATEKTSSFGGSGRISVARRDPVARSARQAVAELLRIKINNSSEASTSTTSSTSWDDPSEKDYHSEHGKDKSWPDGKKSYDHGRPEATCPFAAHLTYPTSVQLPSASKCPIQHLEQLETGDTLKVDLSEYADSSKPRHSIGCTPHECHGSIMHKNGFEPVANSYAQPIETKIREAVEFLEQFAAETNLLASKEDLLDRILDVEEDIRNYGTYQHTPEELEFGCRLAWRNSGRCIMRKVAFSLELRDCRSVKTAQHCYREVVGHLKYAANGGVIKPVISVFPQKGDGVSSPVRIWNRQLIGYAAYKRGEDGTVMGDPVNLAFTALCVKLGWVPPSTKSDFDVLPLIISDSLTGHDNPQVFDLPLEAILEVHIHHPEHEMFSALNLRWYALPAISNMGCDIGGVYYQTAPFNGWYAVTEIGRDFLDKQRYDVADAVAAACNIPRTKLSVWRDDAQLQMHKAILHSFAKASVSLIDHHTASDAFLDFYKDEIAERRKCPADWVWLVPPAGGSMTSVFHQEMVNFIVKPQYRPNVDLAAEHDIAKLKPILLNEECKSNTPFHFNREAVAYDKILLFYGSETGTSQRFVTRLAGEMEGLATGPMPLDDLPNHLPTIKCKERTLLIIAASTFGKGGAPSHAKMFLKKMQDINTLPGALHNTCNTCFCVFALGNSAYSQSFAAFGYGVHDALKNAGALPVLNVQVGDELMDQERSFVKWREDILRDETGIIYKEDVPVDATANDATIQAQDLTSLRVKLFYQGFAQVIMSDTKNELDSLMEENHQMSWSSYTSFLGRSTDLFSFQVAQDQSYKLNDLRPGDHIALYPKNLDDSVDLCIRMMTPGNLPVEDLREKLKSNIDLAKPVSTDDLADLWQMTKNERARYVIASMLRKANKDETDESVVELINKLPPGSIPCDWLLSSAPAMDPRFYSIASISLEERTVSICQSVYSFSNGQAGTTSRWLRSLQADDEAFGVFSQTDMHLPFDDESPCLLIATGTGISPFRSFWMSGARNPMYLFYGCRTHKDLPFASEIDSLKRAGRIHPFIAYSREVNNHLHVQDMIAKEVDTVLSLLHNPKAHIYICGSPDVYFGVKDKLLMVLCNGSEQYPGMKMSQAMEKLVIMKDRKRFIIEVYGTLPSDDDAMHFAWKEATSKVVDITSRLEKLTLPRPRIVEEFKPIRPKKSSWASEFRPEFVYADKAKEENIMVTCSAALDLSRCSADSSNTSVLPSTSRSSDEKQRTIVAPSQFRSIFRHTESLPVVVDELESLSSMGDAHLQTEWRSDKTSMHTLDMTVHSSPDLGYRHDDAPFTPVRTRTRVSRKESWRASFAPEFSERRGSLAKFVPSTKLSDNECFETVARAG